jgi:hypothetical protein
MRKPLEHDLGYAPSNLIGEGAKFAIYAEQRSSGSVHPNG